MGGKEWREEKPKNKSSSPNNLEKVNGNKWIFYFQTYSSLKFRWKGSGTELAVLSLDIPMKNKCLQVLLKKL